MPNLKEVKNRISSVVSTQQITKAMKMVAAAKLRKAQDNIIQMRPYADKLNGILKNVSASVDGSDNENVYGKEREVDRVLIIVVTSDRGLCGAFNANINKATVAHIEENYSYQNKSGDVDILPIGRKGFDYFRKRKSNMVSDFVDTFHDLHFETVAKAAQFAMKKFADKEYDKVDLIYNEFKNVATQILNVEQLLPIVQNEEEADITLDTDYIFQPSEEEIVEELIPKSIKIQLYKAVLESNASEHGARMTAMDQATENAGDLLKELRLTYNRTRQAAITKEILEIVAGAEALGS